MLCVCGLVSHGIYTSTGLYRKDDCYVKILLYIYKIKFNIYEIYNMLSLLYSYINMVIEIIFCIH